MAEPKGVCLSCGAREFVIRYDKKGRPFCKCLVCSTLVFTRGVDAAIKWMARSLDDSETKEHVRAIREKAPEIVAWMESIIQNTPLPQIRESSTTLEDLVHKQAEKQHTRT